MQPPAELLPGIAALGGVDSYWAEGHLYELAEADLQRFHGRWRLFTEQWIDMLKVAVQLRSAEIDFDAGLEAASVAGMLIFSVMNILSCVSRASAQQTLAWTRRPLSGTDRCPRRLR